MGTTRYAGSLTLRRSLGRRLQRAREAAGKTQADVVVAGLASRSKLWRMENGLTPIAWPQLPAFGHVYGMSPQEVDSLVEMAKQAEISSGWAEGYDVPEKLRLFAELQPMAASIDMFDGAVIPGLVQSRSYIDALMRHSGDLDEQGVASRVEFRLERQRLVLESEHLARIRCLVGEAALLSGIGTPAVRADQLRHMQSLSERISIAWLPLAVGTHDLVKGPVDLLVFPDPQDPPVAYLETNLERQITEDAEHVRTLQSAFDRLWSARRQIEEYHQHV